MAHKHDDLMTCTHPSCTELKALGTVIVTESMRKFETRRYLASDEYAEVEVSPKLVITKLRPKAEALVAGNVENIEKSLMDNLKRAVEMANLDYRSYIQEVFKKGHEMFDELKLKYPGEFEENGLEDYNLGKEELN